MFQCVLRRGTFGFGERGVHGRGDVDAVDQESADLNMRHAREGAHLRGVTRDACLGGFARGARFVAGGATGKNERSGHALEVPLEGSADGLVEIVDVKDEVAVGRGVSAEVAYVRIAAELAEEPGGRELREIGGHDGRGAAEISKRRLGHHLIFELDEVGDAAAHGAIKECEGGSGAGFGVELGVLMAADLFAACLAESAAFLRTYPVHTAEHTPMGFARQGIVAN